MFHIAGTIWPVLIWALSTVVAYYINPNWVIGGFFVGAFLATCVAVGMDQYCKEQGIFPYD